MKIYGLYDKITGKYQPLLLLGENHKQVIRENVKWIVGTYPLKDIELTEIGEFDLESGNLNEAKNFVQRNWDDYSFPEKKAEALEPLKAKEMIDKIQK